MARTLIITNDFPPRIGGIESFVSDVCALLDDDVVVYASGPPGAERTDRDRGYPVVRDGSLLLPTPRVAARAVELLRRHRATRVIFGAAAPLGLLAPGLRAAGADRLVGLTHGHETWWATVPGGRRLLRRIGDACDHLTAVSAFTQTRIAAALSPAARNRLLRLPPPVDVHRFRPGSSSVPGDTLHAPSGLVREGHDRPRAVAVGRFVPQKGFTRLLRAWAELLDRWPRGAERPELVLVGDGPERGRLLRMINTGGLTRTVRLTGALPRSDVIAELQRADVFALPMRTRLAGLNPEGLGLAGLEAAACGLPVIIGDSGGAPESLRAGESGFVVPPDDHRALAGRLALLLTDRALARRMGACGREFVRAGFSADVVRQTLRGALG